MRETIKRLTKLKKTIATMESCTGGGIVNALTDIEGANEVLKYSAVTYSNEYKIKMGVNPEIIAKYSVYSMEVANEMSKRISDFTGADYGIGVTGKLTRTDKRNLYGQDNIVYVSIYERNNNKFSNMAIEVMKSSKKENKNLVIEKVINELKRILNQ